VVVGRAWGGRWSWGGGVGCGRGGAGGGGVGGWPLVGMGVLFW